MGKPAAPLGQKALHGADQAEIAGLHHIHRVQVHQTDAVVLLLAERHDKAEIARHHARERPTPAPFQTRGRDRVAAPVLHQGAEMKFLRRRQQGNATDAAQIVPETI